MLFTVLALSSTSHFQSTSYIKGQITDPSGARCPRPETGSMGKEKADPAHSPLLTVMAVSLTYSCKIIDRPS